MSEFLGLDIKVNKVIRNQNFQIHNVRNAKAIGDGKLNTLNANLAPLEVLDLSYYSDLTILIVTSTRPVSVSGIVEGGTERVEFLNQTTLILTSGINDLQIENKSTTDKSKVNVSFIFGTVDEGGMIPIIVYSEIYFSAITTNNSGIAPLGFPVTDINTLVVKNMALADMENDQVTAQGSGVGINKYRICDSNGTANPTGAYIMLLDLNVVNNVFVANSFYVNVVPQ